MKKYFLFVIGAILFFGCSAKNDYILFQKDHNSSCKKNILGNQQTLIKYEYKILPGDLLQIEVINHPEIMSNVKNGTIKVYPDGKVFLPLIGEVKIAGLTEQQASKELTNLYSQYIRHAYVNVTDISKKIYVLGEVKNPGVIQIQRDYTTLIEVISKSGGLTDSARRNDIIIISGGLKNPKIKQVDLTKLSSLNYQSMILKPNDIVYVQPVDIKPFDVKVQGYMPILNFINTLFGTFANIKYISK
jgi:polysaccharide export outer membrane protein